MNTNLNRKLQSGLASRTLIILAFVMLVMIVAVYFVIRLAANKNIAVDEVDVAQETEAPKPVYDTTIAGIRFLLESSVNYDSTMKAPTKYLQDLKTTDKFIKVTIRAQNKGKSNTGLNVWDLGNIIDSEGRNFVPDTNNTYYFLPQPNLCGAILKPEFAPTPCTKIYQVSKASTNLKIQVLAVPEGASRPETGFIDLNIK